MALRISIRVNLINRVFSHLNCPLAYFTISISWDFSLRRELHAWWNRPFGLVSQKCLLRTCFRQCMWTLIQQNFIFACCFLQSQCLRVEKLLTRFRRNGCSYANGSLTGDMPSIGTLVGLLLLLSLAPAIYHWAADVAKANNQTGLASGSSQMWGRQEIALGVYGTAVPTLLRVTLWGPCGAFPTVNDQCVAMILTWPWWSLGGSLLAGMCRIGHSPKKKLLFLY